MPRKYLVTGGAGFIGSNFIRRLFASEPSATVTNLDALTYAGVQQTVNELDSDPRHTFVRGDIRNAHLVDELMPGHQVVIHFAAESHVDRSTDDPTRFLESNIVGTAVVLDAARRHGVPRFVHVSTDEVYGSLDDGLASEESSLRPSSPYSASKAGSDLLVGSYAVTYGYEAIVGRCTNNFGPYQYPEKVIPLFVTNLLDNRRLPLYGEGLNERDWLFVGDHCAALHLLVDEGVPGEIYNIGAGNQLTNLALTRRILDVMGKDESVVDLVADRPGHDLRYAVDASKLLSLGWRPERPFEEDLAATIEWYRSREDWWRPLRGSSNEWGGPGGWGRHMILVTGGSGQLGGAFRRLLPDAWFPSRSDLDLASTSRLESLVAGAGPDAIINCGAYTAVDQAEADEPLATLVNARSVEALASYSARAKIPFVTFSTDYVFDGAAREPYLESDTPHPINVYGRTKLAGERAALTAYPAALVVRTSWMISGTHLNFLATMLRLARQRERFGVVSDQMGCPTSVDDLAPAVLAALAASATGIVHLTNVGATTWFDLARETLVAAGVDPTRIDPIASSEYSTAARRPHYSVLGSERLEYLGLEPLPHWRDSLPNLVTELKSREA